MELKSYKKFVYNSIFLSISGKYERNRIINFLDGVFVKWIFNLNDENRLDDNYLPKNFKDLIKVMLTDLEYLCKKYTIQIDLNKLSKQNYIPKKEEKKS